MLAGQRQTNLPQQLILQTLVELAVGHGCERAEVQPSAGGDNRIHRTDLFEQRLHARLRGDIHLMIALRATYADHLVTTA